MENGGANPSDLSDKGTRYEHGLAGQGQSASALAPLSGELAAIRLTERSFPTLSKHRFAAALNNCI